MSANYFYFQILGEQGKTKSGIVLLDFDTLSGATPWLESRYGGIVVRLHKLPVLVGMAHAKLMTLRNPRLRPKDLAGLLRDLAVMTSSGVPILDAIASISDDTEQRPNRAILATTRRLLDDLGAGSSISEAFDHQPSAFPESVRSLVAIGDETGSMDEMLMEASSHVERVLNMKANAKQALIYPVFVFAAIFGAAAFWIYYVIPNLTSLFKQMNAALPPFTVAVLAGAQWLTNNIFYLLIAFSLVIVLSIIMWKSSRMVRRTAYMALHWLPLSRTLLSSSGLAFLSEYLSILIRAGVDIVKSLRILERTLKDTFYQDRVVAIRQYLERGDRISSAMRQVGGFPAMMTRMISVGEETGTLDRQLTHLANEYRVRLTRVISTLSEIIKPLIIIVAGGVFILLIVALLLPVYDLVRQAMSAHY